MGLGNVVRVGTNVTAFLGVLIALPLSLDVSQNQHCLSSVLQLIHSAQIGGESCMLTLSMLVVVFYWAYSTIHLFTRNSPLRIRGIASVFSLLACFQPLVIAALLLFTLSIHSPQSTLLQSRQTLDQLAQIWRTILLKSSPLFFIAEAIASLIVVQAISRYSSRSIAVSSVPDLLQLLWLIVAAAVYVTSSNFLYQAYESTTDPSTATLLAISVTSVVFLSGISFSIRKGNIVETSGVFAYVVFQVWNLNGGEGRAGLGIYQFIQTKNGHPALPPAVIRSSVLSLDSLSDVLTVSPRFDAIVSQFSAAIDFVRAAYVVYFILSLSSFLSLLSLLSMTAAHP